jgi:hypothetical protein
MIQTQNCMYTPLGILCFGMYYLCGTEEKNDVDAKSLVLAVVLVCSTKFICWKLNSQ